MTRPLDITIEHDSKGNRAQGKPEWEHQDEELSNPNRLMISNTWSVIHLLGLPASSSCKVRSVPHPSVTSSLFSGLDTVSVRCIGWECRQPRYTASSGHRPSTSCLTRNIRSTSSILSSLGTHSSASTPTP